MQVSKSISCVLVFAVLSSCAPVRGQQFESLTPMVEATEISSPIPDLEEAMTQPPQTSDETVVLRSLLGDDEQGEVATSVIELDDGGFMVAGYDYGKSGSTWDALVMRISADGQEVWRRSSDRSGLEEYAWVVRAVEDGHFVVVGTWESENGDMDGFMQGIDADGNELWFKTYGGDKEDILWAAEPTPDGGFLLAGETSSEGAGGLDFYIVKTDADGNELWSKAFDTPVTDRAFGIGVTPDGGALISGFTGAEKDKMNIFFLRINEDGRELWRRTLAGDRFDVAHDVLTLDDGSFVVSGYSSSFSPGDNDGFLMRLTASGRMLWIKTYDDNKGDDRILHVAQLHDGGFAMIGYSNGNVVVWRVDENGELVWSHRDGGRNVDVGKDIIVAHNGSIVAVGGNRSDNPPSDNIILLVLKD